MKISVAVGKTVSVTYDGPCARGGRLIPSKPGPGSGMNAFISPANWTWSRTQTWTPTQPGMRNLWVGWSCTGPTLCPDGNLGIITVTTTTAGLVTADAQQPAAGICGTWAGTVVVIDANPDTPNPRCVVVRADQRLRVVNTTNAFGMTGKSITVTFANYPPRILVIGRGTLFDRPFGTYLAVGVHDVHISYYPGSGGAEVWMK